MGNTNQQWKLIGVGGGFYRIENRSSALVLDAHLPDAIQNGCRMQLWQYAGNAIQHSALASELTLSVVSNIRIPLSRFGDIG